MNEVYAGTWEYGGIKVPVPAIVDRDLWQAAQDQRQINIHSPRSERKCNYLLSGRVRCGRCRSAAIGLTVRPNGAPYSYYVCAARKHHHDYAHDCDLPYFRVHQVDVIVWARISRWLRDPEAARQGIQAYRDRQDEANRPLAERLEVIDGLLNDNRAKLERLLDLYLGGEVDKSFLTERKHRLEQTVQSLEQERAPIAATLGQRALTNGQAATIDELIAKVTNLLGTHELAFETKRQLLEALQTEVTLFTDDDGRKQVSVLCVLGEDVLSVSGNTTSG